MHWIPIGAWCGAALLALVVLGFWAYEIRWKTRRLQRDLRSLQALAEQLTAVRGRLTETQDRLAAARLR